MSQNSAESLEVARDGDSSEESVPVPVTEPAILQSAAEQAGVVFVTKDDNNQDIQIYIDEVMKLSESGSGARHIIITATTAAALLDQQQSKEAKKDGGNEFEDESDACASKPALQIHVQSQKDSSQSSGIGARHIITDTTAEALLDQQQSKDSQKDWGIESEDENDGRASKPALQIFAFSQKDFSQSSDDSGLPTSMPNTSTGASSTLNPNIVEEDNATSMIPAQGMELNDESVNEFQEPPTGKDTEEEGNKITKVDATFKKRRGAAKARDRRKIHQCKECAYCSDRHSSLVRHIKTHTDERPYQCHLCKRAFRDNTTLRTHINYHTGVKPYICGEPDCVMTFVTSGALTSHIRYRHTREKPFKCTLCDYASVEISKLRRHFRSHTGESPYSCEDCGKAFADSFYLKRHCMTHTRERPFKCTLCDYASVEISKLRRHFRSHTGERPYSCEDCGKAFADSSVLKRHRMTHTGEKPYECPECNQRFTQRRAVKIHIKGQHLKNAPKFECEICHTLLGRKYDLNAHILKQHTYQKTPIGCRFCGELFHDRWSLMKHQKYHRSYGTRQPQNGRKAKKRPWEMDDEEEVQEGSTGVKVPMKGKTGKVIPEIDNKAQN